MYPHQPVEDKSNSRTSAKSIRDAIVMLKWRHHVASQRIQDFLEAFFTFDASKGTLGGI